MATSRFPFPFTASEYHYSNNLRPLDPPVLIQVTPEYVEEVRYKRALLRQHHDRCYQSEQETMTAQWEVLSHLFHEMAEVYPQHFTLTKQDNVWTFQNHLLQEQVQFEYLNTQSLGMEPLDFVGRHVQEDLILMSQRDEELVLCAGHLCFPGNWSLKFDAGMTFMDIHHPVPGIVEEGLAEKIQRFLTYIETGRPWTRLNWSLNAGRRLDTSPETFDEWGTLRFQVTAENVAELVHLRVEEQNLFRLPRTQSLLFTIHTYLLEIEKLVKNHAWRDQLYDVLRTLAPPLVEYKGILPFHQVLLNYLHGERVRDDG